MSFQDGDTSQFQDFGTGDDKTQITRVTSPQNTKEDFATLEERSVQRTNEIERKLNEATKEINEKFTALERKTIETLGVFVALFTFVAVEFQIFRSFSSWMAGASLSLLLLGALLIFISVLTEISGRGGLQAVLLLTIGVFSIAFGIWLFSKAQAIPPPDAFITQEKFKDNIFQLETKIQLLETEIYKSRVPTILFNPAQ